MGSAYPAERAYNAVGNRRVRVIPVRASAQPAFVTYGWDPERERYLPTALQVLTLRGERIEEITGFVTPEIFARFGLPVALPR